VGDRPGHQLASLGIAPVPLKPPGATVGPWTLSIYDGVDHRGTVGKVAPGLFA
jgi:hypothetical protein